MQQQAESRYLASYQGKGCEERQELIDKRQYLIMISLAVK